MAVDFPTAPTVGQVVTGSGISWRWDGTAWVIASGPPSAKGVVAYAQVTADQGGITGTAVDLTGLIVSFTAMAGRRYRVTAHAYMSGTVAGDAMKLSIMNGATQLASSQLAAATTPGYGLKQTCMATFNAGASGAMTLKAQAVRSAGTGTLTVVANSGDPAFIMVEDVTYEGGGIGPADPTPAIAVRAWKSANQSTANGAVTAVTFDQELSDPYGFHNTAADTQKFVVPAGLPGLYLCVATLVWNGTAGGAREAWLAINGNTGHRIGIVDVLDTTQANHAFNVVSTLQLAAGEWIEVHVYQNSGAAQNVSGANGVNGAYGGGVSSFHMARLGA